MVRMKFQLFIREIRRRSPNKSCSSRWEEENDVQQEALRSSFSNFFTFWSAVFRLQTRFYPTILILSDHFPMCFWILHRLKKFNLCNLKKNFTGRPENRAKVTFFEVFRLFQHSYPSFKIYPYVHLVQLDQTHRLSTVSMFNFEVWKITSGQVIRCNSRK